MIEELAPYRANEPLNEGMALLLQSGGIIVEFRGMTLPEFYQQISRRLRHQFRRWV